MFLLCCPYQVSDGCEEQDMRRPSQPGVSEAVMTGLTGKSCTKHRKQIFIIMVEFMGSFIPVAMAWLADKSALSYYSCLAMLLIAFRGKRDEIQSLYRRSTLRLRQIKCDFEAAIHLNVYHIWLLLPLNTGRNI